MELWKDIAGYEGLYQVSNTGKVKSLRRTIYKSMYGGGRHGYTRKERIMRPDDYIGYKTVGLSNNGKTVRFKVHRLVATHFIPNPYDKPVINHIDNNPENNNCDNLEWCTSKENTVHSINQGRHTGFSTLTTDQISHKGVDNWNARLDDTKIREIRGLQLSQSKIAKIYGVSKTLIRLIQQRKAWKHILD